MRIARMNPVSGDFVEASFYRPDAVAAPDPDDYFVYDRNIQGPRARFGLFSFSGTGRPTPGDDRGKSSFVGCMVLDPPGTPPANRQTPSYWTLSAALQNANCRVRVQPYGLAAGTANSAALSLSLSQQETDATTVAPDFAALTTSYRLSAYKLPARDWMGEQEWLCTPHRLVGLVMLRSLKEQEAYGMEGNLQMVSGRGSWGASRQFQTLPDNSFQYGQLVTHICDQDFGRVTISDTDLGDDDPAKSGSVLLRDVAPPATGQTALQHYAQGAQHFYLVEVRPASSTPADAVTRLTPGGGLAGFEVREAGHHYRLVHNPTAGPLTYTAKLDWGTPQIWLHRSGEQYRPAWINPDGKSVDPGAVAALSSADVKVTVPAGANIVLTDRSASAPGTQTQ